MNMQITSNVGDVSIQTKLEFHYYLNQNIQSILLLDQQIYQLEGCDIVSEK